MQGRKANDLGASSGSPSSTWLAEVYVILERTISSER